MDIKNMTKEELLALEKAIQKQKEELRTKEIEQKKKENKENIDFLKEHRDVILPLFRHSKKRCSDENPCNDFFDFPEDACKKCQLISILNGACGYNYKVVFDVDIIDIYD